jgi:hypothetical protein
MDRSGLVRRPVRVRWPAGVRRSREGPVSAKDAAGLGHFDLSIVR